MPSKVQPAPVKFIKSIMILQIIILSLLLILLIGVIAQGLSGKHQSDHLTSSITEILKTVQDLTIYKKNDTDMLAQILQAVINGQKGTEEATVQLLQDICTDEMNFTNTMGLFLESAENSLQKLINIIGTLSNFKNTTISTAAVIDDLLLIVEKLSKQQNTSDLFNSITPVSCKDIKSTLPRSPTGYYYVNGRNIYCNMGELCGSGGGWTRLAYWDMNDSTESCQAVSIRRS